MKKAYVRYTNISILVLLLVGSICASALAQGTVIDEIVATVGDKVILKSEVESELMRAKSQGFTSTIGDVKTEVVENMLVSKLLLAQAVIDSVNVTEAEVERQLDDRIAQYVRYSGSEAKLEEYFKKSIDEIKDELRDVTREQLIVQQMQQEVVKDIKVTPSEVRLKYKEIPPDSIPMMPEKLSVQQISVYPEISQKEKDRIQEKLRDLRDRIYKGDSFLTLAVLHSEDPGSAQRGGELGYMSRSNLVDEFANAAFNLKPGKISKIVQTEFGFHIIQLIDRRGDKINVRHILIKPKPDEELKIKAQNHLDTIRNNIVSGKISFNEAAFRYSNDKNSRNNGGLLVNPHTGGAVFEKPELPAAISKVLQGLGENEVSEVFFDESDRREAYKIVQVKSRVPSHKADLNEDWGVFENLVAQDKKQEALDIWIKEKIETTYVSMDRDLQSSNFRYKWIE